MAGSSIVEITASVLLADFIMWVVRSAINRYARYRAGKLRITLGDLRGL